MLHADEAPDDSLNQNRFKLPGSPFFCRFCGLNLIHLAVGEDMVRILSQSSAILFAVLMVAVAAAVPVRPHAVLSVIEVETP